MDKQKTAMSRIRIPLGLLILLLAIPTMAEQAVVVRLSMVYDKASSASDKITKIEAGTRVEILERQGGWKQISSEPKSIVGWVRSYRVRTVYSGSSLEITTKPDSRGFLSGLAAFSRKASSFFGSSKSVKNSSTATIGIRGLSEEEIKGAKPDFQELDKMHQFASSTAQMRGFTKEGQLVARDVPHITEKAK